MMRARKCWMIATPVLLILGVACGRAPEDGQMKVTLEKGAELRVKPLTSLSPVTAESGDEFTATLESPVMGGTQVAIPQGATIVGEVVETSGTPDPASQAAPYMTLKLKEVIVPGHNSVEIQTEPLQYTPMATTPMSEEAPAQPQAQEPSQPQSAPAPDEAVMTFHLSESVDIPVATEQPAPRPVS